MVGCAHRVMRVAFVGKGGSGKSVIAGTVARLLARATPPVLAIDFDTMPGLAYTIGLDHVPEAGLPDDLAVRGKRVGWKMGRRTSALTLVKRHALIGPDHVRFLQIGKLPHGVKPASSAALRYIAEHFAADGWSVVGDFAAGTRQGFFGWAKFARLIAVIVEPSQPSMVAARRLRGLAEVSPGVPMGVIVSKVREHTEADDIARQVGLPLWGAVPYDTSVRDAERQGRALIDVAAGRPATAAITECLRTLQALSAKERI